MWCEKNERTHRHKGLSGVKRERNREGEGSEKGIRQREYEIDTA